MFGRIEKLYIDQIKLKGSKVKKNINRCGKDWETILQTTNFYMMSITRMR